MKYIGSDFKIEPVNTQMQDGKMLDVPDIASASFNSIRQSVADVQRINSTASNADAEATGRKVVVQPQSGGNIFGGIAEIAKVGLGYIDAQKKAEAAAAEKEFILEANKLAANAPDLINKTDQGGIGYQKQVEALAARYAGSVDAAQLQTQLLRLYNPVQQNQEASVTALRKEGDKVRESSTEVFVKTQTLNLDTQLADLEMVSNPEERQTKLNNITKIFTDSLVNSKLRPEERLYATNLFLTTLGKSSAKGSEVGAKVQDSLRQVVMINQQIDEANRLPPEQRAAVLSAIQATVPPQFASAYKDLLNPYAADDRAFEMLKRTGELDAAQRRNELSSDKSFTITDGLTNSLTASYLNADGVQRAMMKERAKGVPALESAINAGDQYLSDRDKKVTLSEKINAYAVTIANLGKGDAKDRLGWIQQAFKLPNISLNTNIVAELAQLSQQWAKAQAQGTPIEVQKAQQDVEAFSKVVLNASNDSLKALQTELGNLSSPWTKVEKLMNDPQQRQNIERDASTVFTNLEASRQLSRQSMQQGTNPNFNMPQLAELQVGDVKLPLPFAVGTPVTFTSDRSPDRNGRPHAGIDIAVASNTRLIAPLGGKVTTARWDDGYGYYVDLRTPDGKYLRFAHLNSMSVKEGQEVMAGSLLGLTGNTGGSTGPHLHFEVRNDMYGGYDKTEDPIAWSVKNLSNANRGINAKRGNGVPNNMPPNAYPLNGAYLSDGKIVRNDGTSSTPNYSARNPITNQRLTTDKSAYTSSPDKNYGYAVLAKDAPFRRELHNTAKRLGVPTQWLADAMAFETGGTFSSSITNYLGYTGLIQFGDEAAIDVGTTKAALARMSNVEQLKYVERFLKQRSEAGGLKFNKPETIILAIWGRNQDITNYVRDPQSIANVTDGDITFSSYVARVGEHAGRSYETSYTPKVAPVHQRYRSSCTACQGLTRAGMGFIPHQAP